MRGQRHAPAAPYPRERPGTHCIGVWVGLRAGLDGWGKSRLHLGFDPRTVQPVWSRYTDLLSRHPTNCVNKQNICARLIVAVGRVPLRISCDENQTGNGRQKWEPFCGSFQAVLYSGWIQYCEFLISLKEESIFVKTESPLIILAILGTIWPSDFLGRTRVAAFHESRGPVWRLIPRLLAIYSAQKLFYNIKRETLQA